MFTFPKVVFSGDLTHLGTFWKTDIQTDNAVHILGIHTPINHMTLYLYGADVASFHNRVKHNPPDKSVKMKSEAKPASLPLPVSQLPSGQD